MMEARPKELVLDFRRREPHHHQRDTCGAGQQLHITEDLTWSAHTDPAALYPQAPEEVWNEPQHPQIIPHLHPDWLHHCLVRKHQRWQPALK